MVTGNFWPFSRDGGVAAPRHQTLIQIVAVAVVTTFVAWFYLGAFDSIPRLWAPTPPAVDDGLPPQPFGDRRARLKEHHPPHDESHPIARLTRNAEREWRKTITKRSHTLETAAQQYRKRRGRHPPPMFDAWYKFAAERDAVIVEEFFDQIYHDLNPFWGVEPEKIRRQAKRFLHRITIRNGTTRFHTDEDREWFPLWHDLIQSIGADLPDVDMPINHMDEPRIMAPWDTINELMRKAEESKSLGLKDTKSEYAGLADFYAQGLEPLRPEWHEDMPYWDFVSPACAPDSPGREAPPPGNYKKDRPGPLPTGFPPDSDQGYVRNFSATKDACQRADLREVHGSFVEPISISTSFELFPMFGGCKLVQNNDILLPPAMYWTDEARYSGGEFHGRPWENKLDRTIWRGTASGGRNRRDTWTRFQRHRFTSMMNGTQVTAAETGEGMDPHDMVLPTTEYYNLSALETGHTLGEWVSEFADSAFVNLECFPKPEEFPRRCPYTGKFFKVAKMLPMAKQYPYKYLPDIDGNSFSGRYRGFLLSTSLPIKATVYVEWLDSRLQPWVHFVPMDNTFADYYGIMDYYLGSWENPGHDSAAKKIALAGKQWAEKVLRDEDMQIYVYRLLLEYARVCDDEREKLAWIEDLTQ